VGFIRQKNLRCKACIAGKLIRQQPKTNDNKAKKPLNRLCIDTLYLTPTSYNGYNYITGYINDYTSLRNVNLSKSKTGIFEAIINKLEFFKT
jgi:hypothetical protein